MPTRIKICGITRLSDALHCAALGVDMLGFNFYPDSPRYIDPAAAGRIIEQLPASVVPVGLMVRPTPADVIRLVRQSSVRMVQVYFPQPGEGWEALPVPVILAHPYRGGSTPMPRWPGMCYLLLDAPHRSKLGGTGRCLNWKAIPAAWPREQLMLAGGLTPDNVAEAVRMVQPAAVDVASGVEAQPGVKDAARVTAFVQAVRHADACIIGSGNEHSMAEGR